MLHPSYWRIREKCRRNEVACWSGHSGVITCRLIHYVACQVAFFFEDSFNSFDSFKVLKRCVVAYGTKCDCHQTLNSSPL